MSERTPSLPYQLIGEVIPGKQLGSKIGFPTANIRYPSQPEQPNGVYVGLALLHSENKTYLTILNQGSHPTFPENANTVEAHFIDYPYRTLYGETITLTYLSYLRPEQPFPSIDALKAQLEKDKQQAHRYAKLHQLMLENTTPLPLVVEKIHFHYDEEDTTEAVSDVSFSIAQGSFVAVLGHNGSGKSTLAKLCNALYLPSEGTVVVCGMDTQKENPIWNIRKKAGVVFQNPDNQIVANVVKEDVAFGLENLGVPQPEMLPRIEEALSAVGMLSFAEKAPHMLSGGQKQRVAVAGVLAMEPEIMIMDESTAMLDPSGRKEVLDAICKLNREKGITVLWITHFMEEAALADHILVMDKGKLAMSGTPKAVFSQVEKIKSLGLDVPPMAELATALHASGMPIPTGILTVDDMLEALQSVL